MAYWRLLRPAHWTKNIFVFAALVFSGKLFGPWVEALGALSQSALAGLGFCLASSAVYILNDLRDVAVDRLHPTKCKRPLAAGELSVPGAGICMLLCAAIALAVGLWVDVRLLLTLLGYLLLMVGYCLGLKQILVLDGIVIAVGFCLRAVAGAVALDVFISPWLLICTFSLCLFLAFGKRRSEIAYLGEEAEAFRPTLGAYTPELLAHMLNVSCGLAVISFLLYAMDARTSELFGGHQLVYTTPLVLFCVFRFSALSQQGKFSGPVALICHDRPIQAGGILWLLACVAIVYREQLSMLLSGG